MYEGMMEGMKMMGAEFVKSDQSHLFFKIPINSDIDDPKKLKRAQKAFKDQFGLGLRIKRTG